MNCSQAILATYGPEFGLDKSLALKAACGFGGGMRMGDVCGAVTGALMVLGLKYGPASVEDVDAKPKTYEQVEEFTKMFKARNASVQCRDLLGCDISTAKGREHAMDKGLYRSVCPKVIRDAAEILEQMTGQ